MTLYHKIKKKFSISEYKGFIRKFLFFLFFSLLVIWGFGSTLSLYNSWEPYNKLFPELHEIFGYYASIVISPVFLFPNSKIWTLFFGLIVFGSITIFSMFIFVVFVISISIQIYQWLKKIAEIFNFYKMIKKK